MDTVKKILKLCLAAALTLWVVMLSVLVLGVESRADDDSSSSSKNSGQTLYDALRAIYGDTSSSSTSSTSTSSSSKNSSSSVTVEQMMKRMETEPIGPVVREVSLSELYHEDYKVYEERLGDSYTIYANVKNGGVTNRPVVIDVPRGVGASMKKDGSDIGFVTKQVLDNEGTYVLDLFVNGNSDDMVPFSEQEFLRAKFRFRIQYSTGVGGVVGEGYEEPETAPEMDYEDLPEDMRPDDFVYDETGETETKPETEEPKEKVEVSADIDSKYDENTGYYRNTLRTGESFYSTLPNGSITNEGVLVQEGEGLTYTVYKNGKPFENFTAGEYVKEVGSFAVYISKQDDASFAEKYKNGNPAFRFRIVSGAVKDLGIITAPQGAMIRSVRYNGLEAENSIFIDKNTIHVAEDGDYEITIDDDAGTREVSFTLDKTQPAISISTRPNEATIVYLSDDVSRCALYRGKELISDPDIVQTVTKAGKYKLYVYDTAGNVTTAEFAVRYRINVAAVIAIVSVIAVIAGVVIYLMRMKKKVKVV